MIPRGDAIETEFKSNGRPAIIVGFEANGLGVARSLAKQGIPCLAVSGPDRTPFCKTNTCEVVHSQAWTQDGLIHTLKAIGKRLAATSPLLITKDEPVLWISDARDELAEWFELSLPDKEVVNLLMNKSAFLSLAKQEGWPIPNFWEIRTRDELMACLPEVIYPCILKPMIKNSAFRNHSPKKAFRVHNREELIDVYDMVAKWEKEVVIQEWIDGEDDHVAFCLTYYDRSSDPVGQFCGRKLRQWPIRCGNTALSESAPIEWRRPMEDLTREIWQRVKFRGLGSIEYKFRAGTNSPVIMEPTVGRTNYQNELAVVNGFNLPVMAYRHLVGLPAVSFSQGSRMVKLIDGPAEIKAAFRYGLSGELSFLKWFRDRRGPKKYMVLRANDIGPFLASALEAFKFLSVRVLDFIFGEARRKALLRKVMPSRLWRQGKNES